MKKDYAELAKDILWMGACVLQGMVLGKLWMLQEWFYLAMVAATWVIVTYICISDSGSK